MASALPLAQGVIKTSCSS